MRRRHVILSEAQTQELRWTRDHSPTPYLRTKTAAILKVAEGHMIKDVAATGLLRPYSEDAVTEWITRYEEEGLDGLRVKAGRGRKPAFSPCAR